MSISIVERIKRVLVTLATAEVMDERMTIKDISEELNISLQNTRNDIAELIWISNSMKYGFDVFFDDESLNDDILKLKKAIINGNLDDREINFFFGDFEETAYINLNYKEYDAVLKLCEKLKWKIFSKKYTGEELYKICREYNTYFASNSIVHANIVEAIENKEWIKITHNKSNVLSFYTIYPIRIIEYESFGRSYVITVQNGEIKPYRLDRIKKVESLKNKPMECEDIKEKDLLLKKLDYVWDMDLNGEFDVKFKVFNDNNGRVVDKVKRDLKQYVERADYRITELDGGHIMVEGHVIGKGAFERYVRLYGASIVVYEPREIAVDIINTNKAKIDMYTSG